MSPQPLDNAEQLKFEYLKRLQPSKRPEVPKLPDLEPDGIVTDEMRQRAHELLSDLDRPPERGPTPEPPDLADDLGMDFGM